MFRPAIGPSSDETNTKYAEEDNIQMKETSLRVRGRPVTFEYSLCREVQNVAPI
jgi:adenine C2-methylase RlmN of 23S rRNA A2503 and tRNA A37